MKKSRRELLRFFEGVLRDHEDDPEVIAHEPIEEVEAYLQGLGLENERLLAEEERIGGKPEVRDVVASADRNRRPPTLSRQAWFGPLSLFPSLEVPSQAVAATATDDSPPSTNRAEAFKEVELDELLDYASAKEVLPWMGRSIRVSRTAAAPGERCIYIVSIDVDRARPAQGALLISLRSDDGSVGEVTLGWDAPAAMISEPRLPADWCRVTISAASLPD